MNWFEYLFWKNIQGKIIHSVNFGTSVTALPNITITPTTGKYCCLHKVENNYTDQLSSILNPIFIEVLTNGNDFHIKIFGASKTSQSYLENQSGDNIVVNGSNNYIIRGGTFAGSIFANLNYTVIYSFIIYD